MYDDPPEELARYFKNLGNETFKKGKLHHKMAMHYYTVRGACAPAERATPLMLDVAQEGLTQAELAEQTEEMKQLASVCLSNRAAVLLVRPQARAHGPASASARRSPRRQAHKRYSQTLKDCEDALVRWSGNVKAYYRGAAAAAQLGSYEKGVGMAQQGLGLEPENRVRTAAAAAAACRTGTRWPLTPPRAAAAGAAERVRGGGGGAGAAAGALPGACCCGPRLTAQPARCRGERRRSARRRQSRTSRHVAIPASACAAADATLQAH